MVRDSQTGLYHEEYFNELLALEKKRAERSKTPMSLMLADLSAIGDVSERKKIAKSMMEVLSDVTRDTDVKGWHVHGLVVGIMFTEVTDKEATLQRVQQHVADNCLLVSPLINFTVTGDTGHHPVKYAGYKRREAE